MNRDLNEPINVLKLQEEFQFSHWNMETAIKEKDYLDVEAEIWPDAPLGLNRLSVLYKTKLGNKKEGLIAPLFYPRSISINII